MADLTHATWMRTGGDNWVFGVPVRGVIREAWAEVYFNEGKDDYAWVWFTRLGGTMGPRGTAAKLEWAVAEAEKALGIE